MIKQIARCFISKGFWAKLSGIRADAEVTISRGGSGAWMNFLISHFLGRLTSLLPGRCRWVWRMNLKGYRYPIYYRMGTSDLKVIRQVFIRREYECVAYEQDVSLIIDCGANIGCTSYYLLNRYSKARIIVVEPDPGNFAMCRRNLEPFGDRVVLVNSGIWPTATPLRITRGSYRDGREWSFQVRPAFDGESSDLVATTVGDLIAGSGSNRVDLLKIDIECAEIQLFSENTDKWLPHTRCLVIELHGTDCERVFFKSMAEYRPEYERSGELTICRNIIPKANMR
jgi:FkbM family methyltransferase